MNCTSCGASLDKIGQQFCSSCGSALSQTTSSNQPPMPTYAYSYSSIESMPMYQNTNTLALVGFITSLFCCGPLAIILSAIGLSQIKSDPARYKGRGLAISGIVIGALSTLFGLIYYLWIGSVIFSER